MEIFIVFRLLSIVLGLLLGFFSYQIHKITKDGGNKGWFYLSVGGMMLCLWAVIQAVTVLFSILPSLKVMSGFVCFSVIGVVVPLGIISLNKAFRIETARFFSVRSMLIVYGSMWFVFLTLNLVLWEFTSLNMELAGIAHLTLSLILFFTIYPAYRLWKTTKVWTWLLIFLFVVFTAASIPFGAYASGCCNDHNEIVSVACEGQQPDYSEIVPISCSNAAVLITKNYHYPLLVGIVLAVIAFYGLWKKMNF